MVRQTKHPNKITAGSEDPLPPFLFSAIVKILLDPIKEEIKSLRIRKKHKNCVIPDDMKVCIKTQLKESICSAL